MAESDFNGDLVLSVDQDEYLCDQCGNTLHITGGRLHDARVVHYKPDKYNVMCGVPSAGRITGETFASLQRDLKHGVIGEFIMARSPYISENRNACVKSLLRHPDMKYLLLVDDDIWWEHDVIPIMVGYMQHHPIVVADIHLSKSPTTGYEDRDGHFIPIWPPPCEGPYTVPAFGSAMVMFRREVFKIIPDNWFSMMITEDMGQIGEDVSFCRRMRKAGLEALLVPNLNIIHWRVMPCMTPGLKERLAKGQSKIPV